MRLSIFIIIVLLTAVPAYAEEPLSPAAQYELGNLYRWGDDKTAPDAAKAEQWYLKAAEQGLADAQKGLGELYMDGAAGIPRDYAAALKWLRKAAEQGDRDAQKDLTSLYVNGTGTPKDLMEACFWAAASGSPETPVFDAGAVLDIRRTLCLNELTSEQVAGLHKRLDGWKQQHAPK